MLVLSFRSKKCESCGKEYNRLTEQEMSSHCVNCGKVVYYCNECIKKGCPNCGGKLVNIWDYHKSKGSSIMF